MPYLSDDDTTLRLAHDLLAVAAWLDVRHPGLDIRIVAQRDMHRPDGELCALVVEPWPDIVPESLIPDLYRAMKALGYKLVPSPSRQDRLEICGPDPRDLSAHRRLEGIAKVRAAMEGEHG